jgi:hypothetical protein
VTGSFQWAAWSGHLAGLSAEFPLLCGVAALCVSVLAMGREHFGKFFQTALKLALLFLGQRSLFDRLQECPRSRNEDLDVPANCHGPYPTG